MATGAIGQGAFGCVVVERCFSFHSVVNYFHKKSSVIDIWQGSKYVFGMDRLK